MTLLSVIGLGSNLGDRAGTLRAALDALAALGRVRDVSGLYEFPPVGGPEQGDFLNAAALIETELEPRALLAALQDIERRFGRERTTRWGPRTLDLDILWFATPHADDALTVPHPRLVERSFALVPLLDVLPDAVDPITGTPYRAYLAALGGADARRLGWPEGRAER